MAKHDVHFEVPRRALGTADVVFRVRANGNLLGTLTVSNGSAVWFPRGRRKGCKMDWTTFDKMMQEHAKRTEVR